MKLYKKLQLLTIVLSGLLIFSCQKVNDEDNYKEELSNTNREQIVLGEKIENPYSVENMKKAYENLVNSQSKISSTSKTSATLSDIASTIEISTNHHYVKFWCSSSEDEEKLTNLEIKFSTIPLDREVLEEGEVYLEESVAEDDDLDGYWVYTSLYVNFDLQSINLEYEILEDLFLFEESQGEEDEESLETVEQQGDNLKIMPLAKASAAQLSFYEQLEKEAFRITGNELEENNLEIQAKTNGVEATERCWFFCSGRTQPKGTIKVKNTVTGGSDPVVGVKVRTYRWFVWGHGYTDNNGNYKINKKYRGNPWYSIDFDNPDNKIKIYSTWLSLSDATYRAWTQSKNGYNKTFDTNSYGWRFATVNNAVVKYRKYCKELGIGTFNSKIRINVTSGTGNASAPMLRYTYGYIGFNSHSNLSNFLKNALLTSNINYLANEYYIGRLIRYGLLPDVWIQGGSSQGTDGVYSTVFHEMGHTSHFAKVGSNYWTKYINYIVTYGSYGDGTGRNVGHCGLGEAWAYHMGHFLTIQEFGEENDILTLDAFENFDPLSRPNDIAKARYTDSSGNLNDTGWTGWIPSGIMNDVIDINKDYIRSGYYDNVSGYTLKNVYNALDSDVYSPQNFRDRLLKENSNKDKTDLINLFEAYYWN